MADFSNLKVPAPNWIDRAVGFVSPRAGFDRMRWRAQGAFADWARKRGIVAGAGPNRLRDDWSNTIRDADALYKIDRQKVRNIVRELVLTNPYVAGAVHRLVANIVGRGINPQCAVKADTTETEPFAKPTGWRPISEAEAKRFQTESEACFKDFATSCDVTGRMTFAEMQKVVARKVFAEDGELLVHFPAADSGPDAFQIELIEIDRLSTPPGKFSDPAIREGVEINPKTGAPVAYWVKDAHPGASVNASTVLGKHRRFEAKTKSGRWQMKHLFDAGRPGQYRGYSPFSANLQITEDLHRYWEAEIVAARVAACYSAFVTSPAAGPIQQAAGNANAKGKREEKLEPGMIWYGNPSEEVTFGNPMRPNSQFGPFTEILLRAIGVALGLPFELIALDFSKTNYSSARAALLEARRSFQLKQAFIVNQFCKPIWEMAILDGIAGGRIYAPWFAARRSEYLSSFWTPPAWGWVDPVKEEIAARESIRGFLSTHADELAAQGRDFDQTIDQCAREHKRLKDAELPSPWDMTPVGAKPLDDPAKTKEMEDALTAD